MTTSHPLTPDRAQRDGNARCTVCGRAVPLDRAQELRGPRLTLIICHECVLVAVTAALAPAEGAS